MAALFGLWLPWATAQQPRLTITLEPPSALLSVGSVLAAPDGNIVVNPDRFAGYQDGAIFVLDSTGHLLRRIPAVEIPAEPYPIWLAPVAKAVLPDGSLIVDYFRERFYEPALFRLRLNPEGVAVTPGSDASLPAGPMIVQPDGGLIIAPEGWGVPLVRFIQGTQGAARGFLSLDQTFNRNLAAAVQGQRVVSFASGADRKLWAWMVDGPKTTNSIVRLERFLPDGSLDPEFDHAAAPLFPLPEDWEAWVGPLPDGRAFVLLPPVQIDTEPFGWQVKRLNSDGTLDSGFQTTTRPNGGGSDVYVHPADVLTPLLDGGLIVPVSYDFVRLQSDGTPDEMWNNARAAFHGRQSDQSVFQVVAQADGRFLIIHGPGGSRFPRPKLGRILADGRLDVETFEPPNRFVSRRIPSIKADGLTQGRWYALERSVGSECSKWEARSYPFQATAADQQPLTVRQFDGDQIYPPVDSVTFWRLQEVPAP